MNDFELPNTPDANEPKTAEFSKFGGAVDAIPKTSESQLTNFEQLKVQSSGGVPTSIPSPIPLSRPTAGSSDDDTVDGGTDYGKNLEAEKLEAKDADGIEKAWVDKAKKLVEHTKDDPYMQERAISRLQADYIKKRFDKDVKLPKESS